MAAWRSSSRCTNFRYPILIRVSFSTQQLFSMLLNCHFTSYSYVFSFFSCTCLFHFDFLAIQFSPMQCFDCSINSFLVSHCYKCETFPCDIYIFNLTAFTKLIFDEILWTARMDTVDE